MSKYTFPDFVAHMHGECEYCHEEDVDLFQIPDYLAVCEDCLNNNMEMCDVCGEIYGVDSIEWTYTDDQRICEYCMENLAEEEDDDEDEDE